MQPSSCLPEVNQSCDAAVSLSPLSTSKTRVAIVADQPQAWARLLDLTPEFECACACSTPEEGMTRIPAAQPHIVVVDLDLVGQPAASCTPEFKRLVPKAEILVASLRIDAAQILEALQSGATGYVPKTASPAQFIGALSYARLGGSPIPNEVARSLMTVLPKPSKPAEKDLPLTEREYAILGLLSDGLLNKEIAGRLHISFDTVRTHLKHVYQKLNVRTRSEAVSKFLRPHSA